MLQSCPQFAIDFNRREMADSRSEPYGQRAGSRTDLEEPVARRRLDGAQDLVCPRGLEKVLSETFSRTAPIATVARVATLRMPSAGLAARAAAV